MSSWNAAKLGTGKAARRLKVKDRRRRLRRGVRFKRRKT
jgi:hypothetical protein